MATVKDFSVNAEKVKLRYRERYLTEGANEKSLALVRGCYRGFLPRKSAVADMKIWLSVDPLSKGLDEDSFAVYAERNEGAPAYDGWALSVREVGDVVLDLTGVAGLDPVPGGVTHYYIYILGNYQVGAATEVTYNVSDADPRIANPDAILIGWVPVVPGATLIDFDIADPATYADVISVRKFPVPTSAKDELSLGAGDDRWGYFDSVSRWSTPTTDQKDAMDGASSPDASNPFAVENESSDMVLAEPAIYDAIPTGSPYQDISNSILVYVGTNVNDDQYSVKRFFNLHQLGTGLPVVGSDGGRVNILKVCLWNSVTGVDPSVDATPEGFISGARVYFDFSETSDSLLSVATWLQYGSGKFLKTLDQAPAGAMAIGSQQPMPHASDIAARQIEDPAYRGDDENVQDQVDRLANQTSGPLPRDYDMTDFVMQRRWAGKEDVNMYNTANRFVVTAGIPNTVGPITVAYVDGKRYMYVINGDMQNVHKIDIEDNMTTVLTKNIGADLDAVIASGAWRVLDSCADDTYIYFRCIDSATPFNHCVYAVKLSDMIATTLWGVGTPYCMLGGGGGTIWARVYENGRARVINATDEFLATNNPCVVSLGSGPPDAPCVELINRSTGVLVGSGEGNALAGYRPMGGIASDGINLVWGAMKTDYSVTTFRGCYISDLTLETSPIAYVASVSPVDNGAFFVDVIFDGHGFWAGGKTYVRQWDVAAGSLGFGINDNPGFADEWFGRFCFDGKSLWMVRYGHDNTVKWLELAAINLQQARGLYVNDFSSKGARVVTKAELASLITGVPHDRLKINQVFFDGVDVWVNVDPSGFSTGVWPGEIRRLTQARDRS